MLHAVLDTVDVDTVLSDAVEISGLSVLLDEDTPYLELRLRAGDRVYLASILAAEEEWALRIRDVAGRPVASEGDLYPTQSAAILAAMLTALGSG